MEIDMPEPQVLFRAGKKRKAYRQRAAAEDDTEIVDAVATPKEGEVAAHGESAFGDGTETSVAEALRLRNARKSRLKGVGFTVESATRDSQVGDEATNEERSVVVRDQEDAAVAAPPAPLGGMTGRFAPQTGLVGDIVNKHM
jgi:hypothetical protein